ncbi:hypothetical protein KP79_PYT18016 [Mizuhopecten yessoensis]|uniref:Uncharacterized protein n=1 Tax=Mizuhopecten yessoensis TaxID=6573 RepID=A0A210R1M5_MIZYE|nr:hypothetical protein KP79_PYT18016 [Mizuhopecten yessoensis]
MADVGACSDDNGDRACPWTPLLCRTRTISRWLPREMIIQIHCCFLIDPADFSSPHVPECIAL